MPLISFFILDDLLLYILTPPTVAKAYTKKLVSESPLHTSSNRITIFSNPNPTALLSTELSLKKKISPQVTSPGSSSKKAPPLSRAASYTAKWPRARRPRDSTKRNFFLFSRNEQKSILDVLSRVTPSSSSSTLHYTGICPIDISATRAFSIGGEFRGPFRERSVLLLLRCILADDDVVVVAKKELAVGCRVWEVARSELCSLCLGRETVCVGWECRGEGIKGLCIIVFAIETARLFN